MLPLSSKNPGFRLLKNDLTRRNEKRVNDCWKRQLGKKAIDKETYSRLGVLVGGSRPPLFYGTVKVHKDNYPLRPIVSAVGSATYRLAIFVSGHLKQYVTGAQSYITNT